MTVYVWVGGQLVDKATVVKARENKGDFPTPMVSRMAPFESPVTGKEISTWRERDADMKAVDAVDLRDYGPNHEFKRGRDVQLKEKSDGKRKRSEPGGERSGPA